MKPTTGWMWILAAGFAQFAWSGTARCEEGTAPRPVVTELMKREFPKETGNEGRMMIVEFAPGAGSPAHSHPGAIFAYVLEGSIVSGLNDTEARTYGAGESWYEEPGCVHRVSHNASATQKARLLVFFVTQPGKPVVIPAKQ
jgi:quercetin dioxygenase-like cupin family protein